MTIRPPRLWSRVRSNFASLFRLDECRQEMEVRRQTRLGLESLEAREMPARYIVDITGPFKVSGGTHVVSLSTLRKVCPL